MDPSRHADERGVIESLLRYIPGFRGYLERDDRRESDQLARNWIADQLAAAKRPLDSLLSELVDQGQLDQLPKADRLKARIDGLASRVRGDVQGYSGFFDFVRVDQELLDKIYQHDMSLMEHVQSFVTASQQAKDQPGDAASVLDDLLMRVDDLTKRYGQRRELLQGTSSK
jgi:hypothetical protein